MPNYVFHLSNHSSESASGEPFNGNRTFIPIPEVPVRGQDEDSLPTIWLAVFILVPAAALIILLCVICVHGAHSRGQAWMRRQQAEAAATSFLATMEAQGTPMPGISPSGTMPLTAIVHLCVQPNKELALVTQEEQQILEQAPFSSRQLSDQPIPASGVASTMISGDLRNETILEGQPAVSASRNLQHMVEQLTARTNTMTASDLHRSISFNTITDGYPAAPNTTPSGCSETPSTRADRNQGIQLSPHTHSAVIQHSNAISLHSTETVISVPTRPPGEATSSPEPYSMRNAGSQRAENELSLSQSSILPAQSRHRNPYAFMLDRGLQDPGHWSEGIVRSPAASFRAGWASLGATILSSRGLASALTDDVLAWSSLGLPVFIATLPLELASNSILLPASRSCSKRSASIRQRIACRTSSAHSRFPSTSPPSWSGLQTTTSTCCHTCTLSTASGNVVCTSSVSNDAARLAAPTSAISSYSTISGGFHSGQGSMNAALQSCRLPPDDSKCTISSLGSCGNAYRNPINNAIRASSRQHVTSQGLQSVASPNSIFDKGTVLRMSDLGEFEGDPLDEQALEWVSPPLVAGPGLQRGHEVPWSELSLLPEGMLPVSIVASGAVAQPWLRCSEGEAQSVYPMDTVYEGANSAEEMASFPVDNLQNAFYSPLADQAIE